MVHRSPERGDEPTEPGALQRLDGVFARTGDVHSQPDDALHVAAEEVE